MIKFIALASQFFCLQAPRVASMSSASSPNWYNHAASVIQRRKKKAFSQQLFYIQTKYRNTGNFPRKGSMGKALPSLRDHFLKPQERIKFFTMNSCEARRRQEELWFLCLWGFVVSATTSTPLSEKMGVVFLQVCNQDQHLQQRLLLLDTSNFWLWHDSYIQANSCNV